MVADWSLANLPFRNFLNQWTANIDTHLDEISKFPADGRPSKLDSILTSILHYNNELKNLLSSVDSHGELDSDRVRDAVLTIIARTKKIQSIIDDGPLDSAYFELLFLLQGTVSRADREILSDFGNSTAESNINSSTAKLSATIEILNNQLASTQNEGKQLRRELKNSQNDANEIQKQIESLKENISLEFRNAVAESEEILIRLQDKQRQVEDLVELTTGSTMARSYAKTAEDERTLANSMRNGSVFLMLAAVLIIGYSLFETVGPNFDWKTGVFRLLFSLALSVPAAYLARESTKHRIQQYKNLKIALELQAITPYLVSLPPEDQHKLKIDVAGKIFGTGDPVSNNIDSYPLNINELFLALISKIEVSKEKKSD